MLRGWCQKHNLKATRTSKTERMWTRNKKTGLFGWKSRKLSVWRCDVPMGTLLRTMDSIDGAGEKTGAVQHREEKVNTLDGPS